MSRLIRHADTAYSLRSGRGNLAPTMGARAVLDEIRASVSPLGLEFANGLVFRFEILTHFIWRSPRTLVVSAFVRRFCMSITRYAFAHGIIHNMGFEQIESKFIATKEKGEVSSLLIRPKRAEWLLVLGHGASTNMRHTTLQTIAERLSDVGIATFRYQFPYMERGGGGRESQAVALETVRSAVRAALSAASDLPMLVGGHSYSGRMSSLAAAERPLEEVSGLVFFAFPLHPAGRLGTERAEHLEHVSVPMLFLSGTRDKLADIGLLSPVCERLGKRATLHLLDTADHGFKVLKRSRKSEEDVFVEMARVVRDWADELN